MQDSTDHNIWSLLSYSLSSKPYTIDGWPMCRYKCILYWHLCVQKIEEEGQTTGSTTTT